MAVTLYALGGFGEIGRNSLAIEIDDKIIICDLGVHLERMIEVTEDHLFKQRHLLRRLTSNQALPKISMITKKRKQVVGIICSHAHVDHIGALPFLANKFSCPVFMTPFTAAVARSMCAGRNVQCDIIAKPTNATFTIEGITIEFIPIAHSTPQSINIAVHTPEGVVLYGNDYKEDDIAFFGEKTDMDAFARLKGKVKVLCLDSLYAATQEHAPGELEARHEVLDLDKTLRGHRAIIASTFSSHIYRLASLCDVADKLGRKVVFVGRSLSKYIYAAKDTNIIDLTKRGQVITYSGHAVKFFKRMKDPKDYFIITTGHQGEPDAKLTRMIEGMFSFTPDDVIVFSSRVIPSEVTEKNSAILREKINKKGVRIVSDVHVSGHGAAKDHKKLLQLVEPEYVIPSHSEEWMMKALEEDAIEVGYSRDQILHLKTGDVWKIPIDKNTKNGKP